MLKNYVSSRTHRFSMKKAFLVIVVMVFTVIGANAQVTTNGGSGLAPTYANLASAITALNGAVISSPVVINLTSGNPQTAPVGGYLITAQGDAVNTIRINGFGNTITASNTLLAGTLNDAIFKLQGADYITLENFVMQENTGNTVIAAATNTMTEWGVALLYLTTTNGAQNNTIQNNTISLNRTYQNTFGIYSNSTHALATPATVASPTSASGANSGLKIYSNTISNVNTGVVVIGPRDATSHNQGLEIGGSNLLGNTINDFGTTGTFSSYASISSGFVNGILVSNTVNYTVSNNTITSSNGGTIVGSLRGVYVASFNNTPIGTITNSINNNTVSLRSAVLAGAGTILGVTVDNTTANATTTLNINANNFVNSTHTGATASGDITFISCAMPVLVLNVNNNEFTNLTVNTTGSVFFINVNYVMPSNGSQVITGNSIVTLFVKTGSGGSVVFFRASGISPNNSSLVCSNNIVSNITISSFTGFSALNITNSGSSSSSLKTINNNVISNISASTGVLTIIRVDGSSGVSTISNNTISNMTGLSGITGISMVNTYSGANSITISSNTISNLNSAGTFGDVIGLLFGNASPGIVVNRNSISGLFSASSAAIGILISAANISGILVQKNKIYDLSGNNASSIVSGISVSDGSLVTLANNIIGDLRTPNANTNNSLIGINIIGGTTVNVYHNTVLLNGSSSGALFGSSAISVSTTPIVTLRNNIFVNNSTVSGAGLAVAHRRSTATLTSYDTASNNNLFYASTIFTDGTNTDASLIDYKTRIATRDAASVTENPSFASTVGSNPAFLHFNTGTLTQIESGATSIGSISDDFDGDVRNATTPDIGADEFDGLLSTESFGELLDLKTYPNPISDILNIEYINDLESIEIYNLLGQQLFAKKATATSTQIDMTSFNSGTYIVKVSFGTVTKTIKVLKR